jgi:hypothetical protein
MRRDGGTYGEDEAEEIIPGRNNAALESFAITYRLPDKSSGIG